MPVITLMGSGETSPTMVKVHRRLLDAYADPAAVFVDTPVGFQENADLVCQRVIEYFSTSLRTSIDVASLRRPAAAGSGPVLRFAEKVASADYVFSGPGSPSYALRIWAEAGIGDVLKAAFGSGASVTLASAAAVTAGTLAIPVYEIYKVGQDPWWLPGLDLLQLVGVRAAVVPHFDNAEGGNHDTRYCYLGANRFGELVDQLPPDTGIVGVDEHTALMLDSSTATATVIGRGAATFRLGGRVERLAPGRAVPIADLIGVLPAQKAAATPAASASAEPGFDAAIDRGDVDAAVDIIVASMSGDLDEAGRMVARLGRVANEGLSDPRTRLAGVVDLALELREGVRQAGDYGLADRIRQTLVDAGIEIQDTPDGAMWRLQSKDTR